MPRFTFFLVVGSLIGFGLASCVAKPVCTKTADCQASEACLPSGLCAHQCTGPSDCLATEKCSTSGGCVDRSGGCGLDGDCPTGQTCQKGGTCATGTSGSGGGTGGGGTGNGGSGGTGGTDGTGGSAGTGGQCGQTYTSVAAPANLMIVLDQSSSMNEDVGADTKWHAAVDAVTLITNNNPSIQFGLEMFSEQGKTCSSGKILVGVGANTASAIQGALPQEASGDFTQIAGGIRAGAADPALTDPTRANGVVVITDGKQNCQATRSVGENSPNIDKPEDVVAELFSRTPSIRTWVVGFGGEVDAARLNTMARNGGTARLITQPSDPRYYQADNSAELQKALQEITLAVMGCSFVLGATPDDLTQLFVGINGQLVPRDTTHVTGWDVASSTSGGVTTSRLTLYGPACNALANTANATLKIVYGCSEGMTEGGSDGGFDFEIE